MFDVEIIDLAVFILITENP